MLLIGRGAQELGALPVVLNPIERPDLGNRWQVLEGLGYKNGGQGA